MVMPVLLPKQGNTVETCLILEWKKKKGEMVKKGEVICEVETDKAVFEIESPGDGFLLDIFFNEGEDVPVLTNIAVIGEKEENYIEYAPEQKKNSIQNIFLNSSDNNSTINNAVNSNEKNNEKLLGDNSLLTKKNISPRAKKLADKFSIETNEIKGSGPQGRIIERDILANKANLSNTEKDITSNANILEENTHIYSLKEESFKVVPLRGIRKIIAERMLESLKNSAQLTLNSSADATALLSLRKKFKSSSIKKEYQSITLNDIIHYAVIKVLPQHLELNSLLVDDQIEYYNKIHLAFAVDTPRGLIVPVIKDSQNLNLLQLSKKARRLAASSISGKIDPVELSGATFTVTNLGSLGIESFTPVLNLPQTGILGVNKIGLKPIDNGKSVEFIPHISFSLTIDHRVIDGAVGAHFLQDLGKMISEVDLIFTSEILGL